MSTTNEVQKIDLIRNEIKYTVHVEEDETGVRWGTWECHECNVGGSTGKAAASVDAAIEASKAAMERHHITEHS